MIASNTIEATIMRIICHTCRETLSLLQLESGDITNKREYDVVSFFTIEHLGWFDILRE